MRMCVFEMGSCTKDNSETRIAVSVWDRVIVQISSKVHPLLTNLCPSIPTPNQTTKR